MANTVIALKKSSTPSAQPVNLANGELAINFADGKLFYKNSTGQIVSFTSGSNSFGTVNANGTLIISDTVGDVLTIEAGNNISIVGDAINDKITISATGVGANVAVSTSQIKDLTSNDYVITSVTSVSQVVDSALMSAAYDKANAANVLAFNTGIGANAFTSATIAGANTTVGAGANAYAASIANTIAIAAFNAANAGSSSAAAFDKANAANIVASSAFDKANSANVLAFNTGIGANAFTSATIAGANTAVGTGANTYLLATIAGANTSVGAGANTFANTKLANTTGTFDGTLTVTGDLITRGNVTLGDASTDTITLNGSTISLGNNQNIDSGTLFIDAVNNRVGIGTTSLSTFTVANLEIKSSGASWYHNSISHGGLYAQFVSTGGSYFSIRTDNSLPQLRLQTSGNSIIMLPGSGNFGIGTTTPTSNLHVIGTANITSNLIVGTTNIVPAIEAAYNQANGVGIAANTYATAAAAGANAFTSATIAGANTSVGTGANTYLLSVIAGANTAVGTGANTYLLSVISGANTAIGAGANTYLLSVIAGANTAVGAGANTWANTKVSSVTGTAGQIFSSGGTTPTINLISSGAATGTYGNSTLIPVITVDSFGRITSASNIAASGGGSAVTVTTAQLKDLTTENTVVTNVSTFTGAVVDSTIAIAAFDKANTGGSGSLTTYSANVGNGAANTYNVSHNLNSYSLLMSMREISTGYIIYPDLQQTTANNLVISFVDNPTANQYALLIAKVT